MKKIFRKRWVLAIGFGLLIIVLLIVIVVSISNNNKRKNYEWMIGTWEDSHKKFSLIITKVKLNETKETNGAIREKTKYCKLFEDANNNVYSLDSNSWAPSGNVIRNDTLYCMLANSMYNDGLYFAYR